MKITKKQQKALIAHLRKKLTQWSSTKNKPANTKDGICGNLDDEITKFLNLDRSIYDADARGVGQCLHKANPDLYTYGGYCITHPSGHNMSAFCDGVDTSLWHQSMFKNKDDKEYIRRRVAACKILAKAPMTCHVSDFDVVIVEFGA